jgi:hypothetical protein
LQADRTRPVPSAGRAISPPTGAFEDYSTVFVEGRRDAGRSARHFVCVWARSSMGVSDEARIRDASEATDQCRWA